MRGGKILIPWPPIVEPFLIHQLSDLSLLKRTRGVVVREALLTRLRNLELRILQRYSF
jgi:hypothetical protein